jgi:hypothetical protein
MVARALDKIDLVTVGILPLAGNAHIGNGENGLAS